MTIDPTQAGAPSQASPPPESSQVAAAAEPKGAAFRVLLERLAQSARDLDSASSEIRDPRELGRVVEDARVSVEEALLLGSDLLEAYRASRAVADSGSTPTPSTH